MSKLVAAERLKELPTLSIWSTMTPLAIKHKAVNLGQGFPNFAPPPFLIEELQGVLAAGVADPLVHQYGPLRGRPELVSVLSEDYSARLGVPVSGDNILVTNGVTQALHTVLQAFVNRGDEVVLVEPFYDVYLQDVIACDGTPVFVSLRPSPHSAGEWTLDPQELRAAITPRTKLMILNTPQNVPGKVWTRAELQAIADVAIEKGITVVADEVYMHLIYGEGTPGERTGAAAHVSIASLPGMFERTITLCSAGKTFSATGWKVGWVVAPAALTGPISQAVCYESFCVATPLQIALAKALRACNEGRNTYYADLESQFAARRALLEGVLEAAGLTPVKGAGGYFVMADISRVDPAHYYDEAKADLYGRDWQFCLWMTEHVGVCAIPTTAFCTKANRGLYEKYVRFAFCKPEAEIAAAGERLLKLKEFMLP